MHLKSNRVNPVILHKLFIGITKQAMRKIHIRKTEECEDNNLNSFHNENSGSTDNFEFVDANKQSELIREFYRLRNVPRDMSVRISELLVEVDRTDVGRKLI